MVKAGGAGLGDVADSVAEAEGMAAFGGEEFESELTTREVGVGARPDPDR
jgi:hypothetical protein